jgi:hypothetical protein
MIKSIHEYTIRCIKDAIWTGRIEADIIHCMQNAISRVKKVRKYSHPRRNLYRNDLRIHNLPSFKHVILTSIRHHRFTSSPSKQFVGFRFLGTILPPQSLFRYLDTQPGILLSSKLYLSIGSPVNMIRASLPLKRFHSARQLPASAFHSVSSRGFSPLQQRALSISATRYQDPKVVQPTLSTPSEIAKKISSAVLPKIAKPDVKKVLVVGSGGLSIGQAGEFDYSGQYQSCSNSHVSRIFFGRCSHFFVISIQQVHKLSKL